MTPSEIAFLGIGLVLGAGIGAALVQVVRARPSGRREVRLTITPNAIPASRTRTLAVPYATPHPGPIPGSPDAGGPESGRPATTGPTDPTPATASAYRTNVPNAPVTLPSSAVAIPVERPGPSAAPVAPPDPRPTGRHPALAPSPVGRLTAVGPGDAAAGTGPGPDATGLMAGRAAVGIAVVDAPAVAPTVAPEGAPSDATTERPAEVPAAFTTLVRPRSPEDDIRPSLAAAAIAVAGRAATESPAPAPQRAVPPTRLAAPSEPTLTRPGQAITPPVRPRATTGGDAAGASITPRDAAVQAEGGPCDGARRVVEERCALAGVTRDQARAATDRLHEARRAYDVLRDHVERAAATADPRHVAAEKDRLHEAFRAASDRAGTPDETEAAARLWLDEINALNASVREAARQLEHGSAELRAALPALERLAAEADAARIASENAEGGCRDARQALAECEEAEARRQPAAPPEEPHPFAHVWPVDQPGLPDPDATPSPEELLGGLPAIIRILRGDREARERLVATLATGDDDRQAWQLRVSRLVDAIRGRAIEDGYLDLPADDPFWRLFEPREARDIVGALSALGFRYDGLGGFADGRVPAARDLSLAVGYAGLDRMRIRTWPAEAGLAELYARAEVAADEWLADEAGDLTLGRMVDALGGRAAELADVWNAWGRVRPALLAT